MDDGLFGPIELDLDTTAGVVTVRGPGIPEVVVRRTGKGDADHVPIGTREPRDLELSVDGVVTSLRPSRARLSRRSYRVLAHVDDTPLLCAPCSPERSRIVRGSRTSPTHEMGIAERLDDGTVVISWHAAVTVLGHTVRAPEPTAGEAAVAYAVAVAFGTGARMMLPVLLDVLLFVPF